MASRTDQKQQPAAASQSLTREELRRAVRRLGFHVTSAQLKRWHKADLLDRPVRRAKGRIEGSESRYPFIAVPQAVTIAWIRRAGIRDLSLTGWYLWCAGFPRTSRVRSYLRELTTQRLTKLRHDLEAFDREDPNNAIEAAARKRLPPTLGRIRRRVGKPFMPTLARIWVELEVGREEVMKGLELEDVQKLLDVGDLFGVANGTAPRHPAREQLAEVRDFLPLILRPVTSSLRLTAVQAALENTSDQWLMQCRDEVQTLLTCAAYGALDDDVDVLAGPEIFLAYFQFRCVPSPLATAVQAELQKAAEAGKIPFPRPSALVREYQRVQRRSPHGE